MMTGIAPSWPQAPAMAAPIPLAPPVTTMTLFSSCNCMSGPLPVEMSGIQSEDLFLLSRWQIARVIGDQFHYLAVAGSQQADRPIRPEHQAIHTKHLKHQIQVRREVLSGPIPPVCFRNQTRNLAIDVFVFGKRAKMMGPGKMASFLDPGLGDVVDHERLAGEP